MPELIDLFAAVDADAAARETADAIALADGTFDFSPDTAETYKMFFIPEGDDRATDKINYNFKKSNDFYLQVNSDTTAKDKDFLLCNTVGTAVAQIDTISSIIILGATDYITTINGTAFTYTSDPYVAQEYTVDTITVDNDTIYTLEINGVEATYTSNAAISQEDTIDTITVANDTIYTLEINGVEATYTSDADATIEEITLGLTDAINALSEPVTATDGTNQFTILADVAGNSFTSVVTAGTMTSTTTTDNEFPTSDEIIAGIVNKINNGSEPVTANNNTTNITLVADVAGTGFTATINENMSIVNTVPNSTGIIITLPATPADYEEITILDINNNFATNEVTLDPGTGTIMGLSVLVLTVNNSKTKLLSVGSDWRII